MQKLGFHSVAHMFDFMEHRSQYGDDLELKSEFTHHFTDRMYPGRTIASYPQCPIRPVDGTRNRSRPTRRPVFNKARRMTRTIDENRASCHTSGQTLSGLVSRHVESMAESRQQLIEKER